MFKGLFKLFKKKLKVVELSDIEEHLGWESAADPKFVKLLEYICQKDKERYFLAANDQARDMIRGAYLRNKYLIRELTKYMKLTEQQKKQSFKGRVKMNLPRYE